MSHHEVVSEGAIWEKDGIFFVTPCGRDAREARQSVITKEKWCGIVRSIDQDTVVIDIAHKNYDGGLCDKSSKFTVSLKTAQHLPTDVFRIYWPPQFRGECPECFGTGFKGGFQAPCSRGC